MSMVSRSFGVVALASGMAIIAPAVHAQETTTVPDAQVESNVLKALASAPELSTQNIQSSTVYGTVTLSGNVHDEALRTRAENLVARAAGVKKVVDQLSLGDTPAPAEAVQAGSGIGEQLDPGQGNQPVLQSDGTYAPSPDGTGSQQQYAQQQGSGAPPPPQQQGYYGQMAPPPQGRQPLPGQYAAPPGVTGGQQAGLPVTIPAGAMLRIRINRGLDSQHITPGTPFDGTVLTDVIADNAVAIPRGATVTGVVVDSKKAGVFKGDGELSLQINSLTLGGQVYPLQTDIWQRDGRDKTAGTVNRTVGTAAIGALFGALAGGGTGAAIGAGVGGGVGLASSAGGPRGQIIVPPESVLTFKMATPVNIRTISEQEMSRLSYAAGPQQPVGPPPMHRYYSPYYGYYYAPYPRP